MKGLNILILSQFFSTTKGGGEYVFSVISKSLANDGNKLWIITNEIKGELIEYVAKKRPELTFIFIGHTFGSDVRKLMKLENVHFLGEQPYSELPKYLHAFDVCLIPFKSIPLIEATHPVKIYEYMAAGKPVVTTNMKELSPMKEICYISKNKEDFLKNLNRALDEKDKEIVQKRIDFASKNTWDHRINSLYSELEKNKLINLHHHN